MCAKEKNREGAQSACAYACDWSFRARPKVLRRWLSARLKEVRQNLMQASGRHHELVSVSNAFTCVEMTF